MRAPQPRRQATSSTPREAMLVGSSAGRDPAVPGRLLGCADRGVADLRVDAAPDTVHTDANVGDGEHSGERDEAGKQGVLDEVLPLGLALH